MTNTGCQCEAHQIPQLVEQGAMEAMCSFLGTDDTELLLSLLEGVHNVLAVEAECGTQKSLLYLVSNSAYVRRIEALELHNNVEVYKKVSAILQIIGQAEACSVSAESVGVGMTDPQTECGVHKDSAGASASEDSAMNL